MHCTAGNRLRMKGPLKLRPEQDWRSPLPPGDELLVWLMAAAFFDASRIAARDQAAAVKMKKRPRSYTRRVRGSRASCKSGQVGGAKPARYPSFLNLVACPVFHR